MERTTLQLHFYRYGLVIVMVELFFVLCSCEDLVYVPYEPVAEPATSALIDSATAEGIMKEIHRCLRDNELLGIQVCVTDSLNRSWSVSVGATDLDQKNPLQDHHVLRVGSVTKIYTATLVMRLIEEGYLTLDGGISAYFPGYDHIGKVAIRDLLQHSSGITDIFAIPAILINASHFPGKRWDPLQLAEACLNKQLHFEPGSDQAYSNTNYILLGLIAEEVTGKPLSGLYREYLFDPAGTGSTFFVPYDPPPAMLISGFVHHYALSATEWYPNVPGNTSWSTLAYSAGALVTNATELSAFICHLFRGDLLRVESLEQMTEFSGRRGLGLVRMNVNGRLYYGHEGELTGFESIAAYQPDSGWTISICCNTTPFRVQELLDLIDARL